MKQEKPTFAFTRVDTITANASSAKLTIGDDLQGTWQMSRIVGSGDCYDWNSPNNRTV